MSKRREKIRAAKMTRRARAASRPGFRSRYAIKKEARLAA